MRKNSIVWLVATLSLLVAIPVWAGEGSKEEKAMKRLSFFAQSGEPGNFLFSGDHPLGLFGKGFLGVGLTNLTPELRAHFAESEDAGVMVDRVVDGSPAAKAGLQVGDVITAVDGELVKRSLELVQQVRKHEPEDQVSLEVFRDGRRQLIDVTLAERDRAVVDLGRHFEWKRKGEGGPWVIELDREGLKGFPEGLMDRAQAEKLRGVLEKVDWPSMAAGAARFGSQDEELKQRLEELEKRLKELSERLAEELPRLHEDQ